MRTADFTYFLPDEVIAQQPVEPRDAARLLDTRDMTDHTFRDLTGLLGAGDLVVVNTTRVRAARLLGTKRGSGGSVEVLLLRASSPSGWEALIKPARRVRRGTVLDLPNLVATVTGDGTRGVFELDLDCPDGEDVEAAIARIGTTPLPPYIRRPLDDEGRYQTVFADRVGSAAAPTAGLHFTQQVLDGLQQAGIGVASVELEVGLDTFRPITTDLIAEHQMHTEKYSVPDEAADAINETRRAGGRIVAVGTTVVRTLESAASDDGVRSGRGVSGLFITPGYRFRVVDLMITNFHVPSSTLLVLLQAFMGDGWRLAYAHALARGYRFLSFGDAMLAERSA
jgi:S-adenosylmethionine:tRNA ribosyltransferase-isomerase